MGSIRRLIHFVFAAALAISAISARAEGPRKRDVAFLVTSDCHYVEAGRANNRNASNRVTIDEMNQIATTAWPATLGGGMVGTPRGVIVLGDCIDNGDKVAEGKSVSAEQYGYFSADFGLDGTDGRLKFPVFEGWGNHDGPPVGKEKNGFSFQAHLKQRNQARLRAGRISNLSPDGLHYSWDWDDVHLVQLNLYPADRQSPGVRYSAEWHNPQDALAFLKKDLAEKVGSSGRPVILMSHCGFDTDWWFPNDWRAVYDAAKPYNVVVYLYGHTGTGVRWWAPSGKTNKWLTINDGQTEKGFFVVNLDNERLRAGMRIKSNYIIDKGADGSIKSHFDGNWEWKWQVQRPVNAPTAAQVPASR